MRRRAIGRRYRRWLHHSWHLRSGIRPYNFVFHGIVDNQRDRALLAKPPMWRGAPFRNHVDRHGYILTPSFADKLPKVPWLAVDVA